MSLCRSERYSLLMLTHTNVLALLVLYLSVASVDSNLKDKFTFFKSIFKQFPHAHLCAKRVVSGCIVFIPYLHTGCEVMPSVTLTLV